MHRLGWKLSDGEQEPIVSNAHLKEVELRVPLASAVAAREQANPSPPTTAAADRVSDDPASVPDVVEVSAAPIEGNEDPGPNGDVKATSASADESSVEPVRLTVNENDTTIPCEDAEKSKDELFSGGSASSPIDVDNCTDELDATFNLAEFLPGKLNAR